MSSPKSDSKDGNSSCSSQQKYKQILQLAKQLRKEKEACQSEKNEHTVTKENQSESASCNQNISKRRGRYNNPNNSTGFNKPNNSSDQNSVPWANYTSNHFPPHEARNQLGNPIQQNKLPWHIYQNPPHNFSYEASRNYANYPFPYYPGDNSPNFHGARNYPNHLYMQNYFYPRYESPQHYYPQHFSYNQTTIPEANTPNNVNNSDHKQKDFHPCTNSLQHYHSQNLSHNQKPSPERNPNRIYNNDQMPINFHPRFDFPQHYQSQCFSSDQKTSPEKNMPSYQMQNNFHPRHFSSNQKTSIPKNEITYHKPNYIQNKNGLHFQTVENEKNNKILDIHEKNPNNFENYRGNYYSKSRQINTTDTIRHSPIGTVRKVIHTEGSIYHHYSSPSFSRANDPDNTNSASCTIKKIQIQEKLFKSDVYNNNPNFDSEVSTKSDIEIDNSIVYDNCIQYKHNPRSLPNFDSEISTESDIEIDNSIVYDDCIQYKNNPRSLPNKSGTKVDTSINYDNSVEYKPNSRSLHLKKPLVPLNDEEENFEYYPYSSNRVDTPIDWSEFRVNKKQVSLEKSNILFSENKIETTDFLQSKSVDSLFENYVNNSILPNTNFESQRNIKQKNNLGEFYALKLQKNFIEHGSGFIKVSNEAVNAFKKSTDQRSVTNLVNLDFQEQDIEKEEEKVSKLIDYSLEHSVNNHSNSEVDILTEFGFKNSNSANNSCNDNQDLIKFEDDTNNVEKLIDFDNFSLDITKNEFKTCDINSENFNLLCNLSIDSDNLTKTANKNAEGSPISSEKSNIKKLLDEFCSDKNLPEDDNKENLLITDFNKINKLSDKLVPTKKLNENKIKMNKSQDLLLNNNKWFIEVKPKINNENHSLHELKNKSPEKKNECEQDFKPLEQENNDKKIENYINENNQVQTDDISSDEEYDIVNIEKCELFENLKQKLELVKNQQKYEEEKQNELKSTLAVTNGIESSNWNKDNIFKNMRFDRKIEWSKLNSEVITAPEKNHNVSYIKTESYKGMSKLLALVKNYQNNELNR